jgi:uncharacterized spore protein YtfJ
MPTMDTNTTQADSVDRPTRRADDLLSVLAERVGTRFSATTVFGTPVERDGVTVVPVAAARFAFGGGAGGDRAKSS